MSPPSSSRKSTRSPSKERVYTSFLENGLSLLLTHTTVSASLFPSDLKKEARAHLTRGLKGGGVGPSPQSSSAESLTRATVHARATQAGFSCCVTSPDLQQELWMASPHIAFRVAYEGEGLPIEEQRATPRARVHALIDQSWHSQSVWDGVLANTSVTFTRTGRLVSRLQPDIDLSTLLHRLPALCALTRPLEEEVYDDPYVSFGDIFDKEIAAQLPASHPLLHALERSSPRSSVLGAGFQELEGLRDICALENVLRQKSGRSSSLLEESQSLYEQWIAWINDYPEKEDLPSTLLAPPHLGPMLALPSLLLTVCADPDAQHKLEVVLNTLTDEALHQWWCTPDALGKTGAQWCLTGLWGDGGAPRLRQRLSRAKEENRSLPHCAWVTRVLPFVNVNVTSPRFSEQRLAWGKRLLAQVASRLSGMPDAWVTDSWSPAGLWTEALFSQEEHALACVSSPEDWRPFLPVAAWTAPLKLRVSLLNQKKVEPSRNMHVGHELLNASLVCSASTPSADVFTLLQPARAGSSDTPWSRLLHLMETSENMRLQYTKGPFPYPKTPKDLIERALQAMLSFQYRLREEESLGQALKEGECPERGAHTLTPLQGIKRLRV